MGGPAGTPPPKSPPNRERRAVARFALIATVEMTEPSTDTRFSGRVSELSRNGCYVDVLNALPEGTLLQIRISRDRGTFATKGKIIYAHPGMGMGVTFLDTSPEQLKILDSWLAELSA